MIQVVSWVVAGVRVCLHGMLWSGSGTRGSMGLHEHADED